MEGKIYKAMCDIQAEIDFIDKQEKNVKQNYNFRGIDTVYNELHKLLAKYRVFTLPEVLESRHEERESKSGGLLIYRVLRIKYTFYHEDGSSVYAIVEGEGMDSGDKACNKSMSAAHKYLFIQAFSIPTKEEKDADHYSPDPKPKKHEDTKSNTNVISEAQRKRLFAISQENLVTQDNVKKIIAKFGYDSTKVILKTDYEEICRQVENYQPDEDEQEEIF